MYKGKLKTNAAYDRKHDDGFIFIIKQVGSQFLIADIAFEEDEDGNLIPDNNPLYDFKWHLENERLVTENVLRYMIYD